MLIVRSSSEMSILRRPVVELEVCADYFKVKIKKSENFMIFLGINGESSRKITCLEDVLPNRLIDYTRNQL